MTYTLHHGDCLDVLPTLRGIDAVVTDPPYGISLATNYRERKRGALALCNNFAPIAGDNKPFDPTPFLRFRTVVLFGANYYADKLPTSGGWIVWDKVDGLPSVRDMGFNDNSDCELIWTNKGNAARILRHRWMGAMKDSEQQERRVHPTQKPVELMRQIIRNYTRPNDTVADFYMGSGTTGVAAILEGRNFVGVEKDAAYFDIASKRIADTERTMRGEFKPLADVRTYTDMPIFAGAD
jgi:site-specific DNA-methyltransferase (adenine-specific)